MRDGQIKFQRRRAEEFGSSIVERVKRLARRRSSFKGLAEIKTLRRARIVGMFQPGDRPGRGNAPAQQLVRAVPTAQSFGGLEPLQPAAESTSRTKMFHDDFTIPRRRHSPDAIAFVAEDSGFGG